ncbi:MAG TPA: hypothetical protein VH762_08425 [Gemmatimonadaceae bacterium]|jgi:hypothetical protein
MFLTLLLVTFVIAALVSFIVARLFDRPLRQILGRLVAEDLSAAWHRYIVFAIYVVGISGGVRVWSLEQYILPRDRNSPALELTPERWTLEVYRTVIGTLQSVAWMLLVFFVFALIAYVVVRGLEMRHAKRPPGEA